MSGPEAFASMIAVVGAFATPVAMMYLWVNRPSAKTKLPDAGADPQLHSRLDRLEAAVEAIAVETERISEGQRFLTKALTASAEAPHDGARTIPARAADRRPAAP